MADQSQPSRTKSLIVWLVLAVGALAVLFVVMDGPVLSPDALSHPSVGRRLSQVKLQPLTGLSPEAEPVELADLQGKVTLLNFWGTWCPPCVVELPHIARLWQKHSGRDDFRLYAVSSGTQGDADLDELRETTQNFLDEMKITMPTYADRHEQTRHAAATANAFSGYPTTILLDRQGVIRAVWTGYHAGMETQIDRMVIELLDEAAT